MADARRKVVLLVVVPLMAGIVSAFLLNWLNGPVPYGLNCARSSKGAECEVLETQFFGWFWNSSFPIAEASIKRAKGYCTYSYMGRGGHSCDLYLVLDSGKDYGVAGYGWAAQAKAQAERLNSYLQDPSQRHIEIRDNMSSVVFCYVGIPVLFLAFMGVVVGMGRRMGFSKGKKELNR